METKAQTQPQEPAAELWRRIYPDRAPWATLTFEAQEEWRRFYVTAKQIISERKSRSTAKIWLEKQLRESALLIDSKVQTARDLLQEILQKDREAIREVTHEAPFYTPPKELVDLHTRMQAWIAASHMTDQESTTDDVIENATCDGCGMQNDQAVATASAGDCKH